ncbi:hypothetical protein [Ferruginibacter sp. SUN106]|uniref:hypothetical protein n=1 Tax=Ferruginibacter sp. SUN106 TaxID=2978348 RepID=UPI003D362621
MLIKQILIAYSFLISANVFAQDKTNDQWQKLKVDENLTAMFPKDVEKIDTLLQKDNIEMKFKVFKATTAYANLGITVTTEGTDIKADNAEDLERAYKGIEIGFRKNATSRGLTCIFSDTVVDKITGRKAVLYTKDQENSSSAVFYLFLLNDKLYEIASSPVDGSAMEITDRSKLVAGLHFTAVEISEKKFGSKAESWGYKIGELIGEIIGFLAIAGLIVGIIIYITKRK